MARRRVWLWALFGVSGAALAALIFPIVTFQLPPMVRKLGFALSVGGGLMVDTCIGWLWTKWLEGPAP